MPLESWRKVWRDGVAPLLSVDALEALREGLERDDIHLTQGVTTRPLVDNGNGEEQCQGACVLGYCGWQGEGLDTIGRVEEFFARMCFEIDKSLGEPAGCRWFLNWWDESPRDEVRRELLAEVHLSLADHYLTAVGV